MPTMMATPGMSPNRVIVFDGECVLCAWSVRFIAERDRQARFHFTVSGSTTARILLAPHGIDAVAPGSVVLVEDGAVYTRSEAALRIAGGLPWPWCWLTVLRAVPRALRDAVYEVVARYRYRWFGRRDRCAIPSPAVQARLLD